MKVSEVREVILLLFADDILLWGETQAELQLQLDALRDYCRQWQLEVSAPKTKVLLSPHAKLDSPLTYDGKPLDVVDDSAYLGVLFSGKGDFSAMIDKTVKKALGRQSALASILTNRQLPMLLRYAIWTTMVRPILEWGLEVYTPPDMSAFEAVQRAALRMIAGAQAHTPIVALEGEFGACSISDRADMRKCALLGKLHHAPKESLLGQLLPQQERGRGTRGKRTLREELKRLTREVLQPAGLLAYTNTATCADESASLAEWRDSARAQVLANGAAKRSAQLEKLSSLAHLKENGTDYSSAQAHPYTTSTNGKAASLWFKARSNTLPLGRLLAKSGRGVSDVCKCCKKGAREDLMHFLCDCPGLRSVRSDWLRDLKKDYPECRLTMKSIPKLVLGPASALQDLPQPSTQSQVSSVETLLTRLWAMRNALHHGSRVAKRPTQPKKPIMSHSDGSTRERKEAMNGLSSDTHSSNLDSASTNANGYLTRARARLLLQRAGNNADGSCQQAGTPQAIRPATRNTEKESVQATRAPRSRSQRLESMEEISKT